MNLETEDDRLARMFISAPDNAVSNRASLAAARERGCWFLPALQIGGEPGV